MPEVFLAHDTTLLSRLENLRRVDTGAPITSGVMVTCSIFALGTTENPLAEVTLAHQGSGNWSAVMAALSQDAGTLVDVRWQVDGGASLRATWWERRVRVVYRSGEE